MTICRDIIMYDFTWLIIGSHSPTILALTSSVNFCDFLLDFGTSGRILRDPSLGFDPSLDIHQLSSWLATTVFCTQLLTRFYRGCSLWHTDRTSCIPTTVPRQQASPWVPCICAHSSAALCPQLLLARLEVVNSTEKWFDLWHGW